MNPASIIWENRGYSLRHQIKYSFVVAFIISFYMFVCFVFIEGSKYKILDSKQNYPYIEQCSEINSMFSTTNQTYY